MERLVYSSHQPPRQRRQPLEVVALGLSRSGTDSLRNALVQLGYDHVWHGYEFITDPGFFERWVRLARKKWSRGSRFGLYTDAATCGDSDITAADLDAIIGHYTAATDMPCYMFGHDFISAYPDAKVILNVRTDEDAWYRSTIESFRDINMGWGWRFWLYSWFHYESYWCKRYWDELYDSFFQGPVSGNGKWVRREYHAMVRGSVPSDRLLEWCVQDGGEPLCAFLEKPVPDTEFPNGNPKDELLANILKYTARRDAETNRNICIVLGGLGAMVAAAVAGVIYWRQQ